MTAPTVEPEARAGSESPSPRRRRIVPVHPVLLAIWPVLFLYGQNLGETPPPEAAAVTALAGALAAVVWTALTAVFSDVRRAAVITSVLALAILLEGHVRLLLGEPPWLFPAWTTAAAVAVFLVSQARPGLRDTTRVLNTVAVGLVVVAAAPIAYAKVPEAFDGGSAPSAASLEDEVGQWALDGPPRDIYYLVFDRYASERALAERFGFDNSPTTAALEARGFTVADDSIANHLKTAQSLASTLNLRYLDDFEDRYGPDTGNLLPVYDLLADHEVGTILKRRGYRYVHIGAWWDPTQSNPNADFNWGFEHQSDFVAALQETSLLPELVGSRSGKTAEQLRRQAYEGTLDQFQRIRQASRLAGPTFTLAHILLPHQPFVFDRDGRYRSIADTRGLKHDDLFVDQLTYTNRRLLETVDLLLDVPEDERPIIVVQADEGPHPLRNLADEQHFDWHAATSSELREKLQILNALYLPGVNGVSVPDDMTPVNTWRLLFNTYFGADLPLLPDRSYVFRNLDHVYDFRDVTDVVR